jgi:hypothetical protein
MIARQDGYDAKGAVWDSLSAPFPTSVIDWRQDGKPTTRDGKHYARFVAYISANTVRERLDGTVPGEWDLTLEMLPQVHGGDDPETACAFKARLQVLGVIREDVGTGRDYKNAATDAFKRSATRFGIGYQLYELEQNWVEVDGDGKYAKPVEDPGAAYARRHDQPAQATTARTRPARPVVQHSEAAQEMMRDDAPAANTAIDDVDSRECPKCGGRVWDNRLTKRNPKAPDFKCRDRNCDGVIWPDKPQGRPTTRPGDEPMHVLEDEIPF